jgi:hypothetical protein
MLAVYGPTVGAIVANLIGALIFFWIDMIIFKKVYKEPLWEIKEDVVCHDCGAKETGYRIVEWMGYSRSKDANPEFRCDHCRFIKYEQVKQKALKKTQI